MTTQHDKTEPGKLPLQTFGMARGYRIYFTAEAWVITYNDVDFVRINRIADHKPGFIYICAELIFMLLWGKRTELRDRYAIDKRAEDEAHELDMRLKASHESVLEIRFVPDHRGRFIPENLKVPDDLQD